MVAELRGHYNGQKPASEQAGAEKKNKPKHANFAKGHKKNRRSKNGRGSGDLATPGAESVGSNLVNRGKKGKGKSGSTQGRGGPQTKGQDLTRIISQGYEKQKRCKQYTRPYYNSIAKGEETVF